MKIQVNLATRPFVELRPIFLRLRIVMGVLAAVGVGLILWTHVLHTRLVKAQSQMNVLVAKTQIAQNEKTSNERRMHQPQNAAVLERAHFLNALFLRKSFSWTAVMMDLETVLPPGVMVTSIEPQVAVSGDVAIRLRVAGDRDRAVQLVRNLERSKRFLRPELRGEATQAKDNQQGAAAMNAAPGGVEFEISAIYNPLGEEEVKPKDKAAEGAEKSAATKPSAKKAAATASPARPAGAGISANPRGKYPPNGVVLKPYPNGAAQNGGRP